MTHVFSETKVRKLDVFLVWFFGRGLSVNTRHENQVSLFLNLCSYTRIHPLRRVSPRYKTVYHTSAAAPDFLCQYKSLQREKSTRRQNGEESWEGFCCGQV